MIFYSYKKLKTTVEGVLVHSLTILKCLNWKKTLDIDLYLFSQREQAKYIFLRSKFYRFFIQVGGGVGLRKNFTDGMAVIGF